MVHASSAGFSGGNFAKITINDTPVNFKDTTKDQRGLHIAVINPSDFKVSTCQIFDTYKSSSDFEAFTKNVIPDGYIVVAACKDECTQNLSERGRRWFQSMGSVAIKDLEYRCGFAFIGVVGDRSPHEKRSEDPGAPVSVT